MNHSVTLYHHETTDIKIDIEARFEGDTLVIDGYDIGERVKDYWGDSDYEYSITIPPNSVNELYSLLKIEPGDKQNLLKELAKRYNTNTCFSDIRKLLDDNHMACEGFSWI